MANFFDDVLGSEPVVPPPRRNFFEDVTGSDLVVPPALPVPASFSSAFAPQPRPDPRNPLTQKLRQRANDEVTRIETAAQPPPAPANYGRSLMMGVQDVGRGAAHLAGMPVDLVNTGLNILLEGADQVLPGDQSFRFPVGAGERIRDMATTAAKGADVPIVEWKDRNPREQLVGNVIDYSTQALGGGAALARQATKAAATSAPNAINAFLRPYAENAGQALTTDVAAGAGAGVGHTIADTVAPGNPFVDFLGTLGGSIGALGSVNGGRVAGDFGRTLINKKRTDNAFMDVAGPDSPRRSLADTEAAAREMQQAAGNLTTTYGSKIFDPKQVREARDTLVANANDVRSAGTPESAIPTSGLLSRNVGLVSKEGAARTTDAQPFIPRDQAVKGAAAEKVASLKDPTADQGAVAAGVGQQIEGLQRTRELEAMPLLKQAEQAGAVVDPQPVADMIDAKLATDKRPPVRAALTEARKMLNVPGGDTLDTSVSGLYETRKAINDIIEGRGENPTGRYAQRELMDVRDALDKQINAVAPDFGAYLNKYKEKSVPLDEYGADSVTKKLLGDDPRNVAKSILSGGYDGAARMDEVNRLLGSDPAAKAGWKAAVAEVLSDRVATTKDAGGNPEVAYAALAKEFQRNRDTLAKVFSPQEMNTLQQAHTLLGFFKEAEKRATVGSNTADKLFNIPRSIELAIRHRWGDLKGGGIVRRMRLFASLLPTGSGPQEIVQQAWFNPDVAAYLLGRETRQFDNLPNNSLVKRAIALESAANTNEEDNVGDVRR